MGLISVARVLRYPALLALAFCGLAGALPNIVYILADDMGQGDVSGYNPASKVKTPAMDALIADVRAGRDASTNIELVRRALDDGTVVADSLSLWSTRR